VVHLSRLIGLEYITNQQRKASARN